MVLPVGNVKITDNVDRHSRGSRLSGAFVAGWPSPEKLKVPLPATVLMMPAESTLRIRELSESADVDVAGRIHLPGSPTKHQQRGRSRRKTHEESDGSSPVTGDRLNNAIGINLANSRVVRSSDVNAPRCIYCQSRWSIQRRHHVWSTVAPQSRKPVAGCKYEHCSRRDFHYPVVEGVTDKNVPCRVDRHARKAPEKRRGGWPSHRQRNRFPASYCSNDALRVKDLECSLPVG